MQILSNYVATYFRKDAIYFYVWEDDIIISMKVPNIKNAIVEKRKLTHYLLSLMDEDGKPKAEYFRKVGFNEINLKDFEGKKFMVRTVWSINKGEKNPRLVTAYHV